MATWPHHRISRVWGSSWTRGFFKNTPWPDLTDCFAVSDAFAVKEELLMRQLSFVLQVHGNVAPVAGAAQTLQARTIATNQTFRTVLAADGIQATLEGPGGGHAAFTSRVVINADGTFDETGAITYGDLGTVEFKT